MLFGGATKDTGSFAMTSQTFVFNMSHKRWTELIPNGATPAPRAAHAAASVEQLQVAIYGGQPEAAEWQPMVYTFSI